jgi:hypothetical protein
MKLNIKDRIHLLDILPKEGNFVTMRALKEVKDNLAPTEEEVKELNIQQSGNNIVWNASKDTGKEIIINDIAGELISKALMELDKNNKLNEATASLYPRFVPTSPLS